MKLKYLKSLCSFFRNHKQTSKQSTPALRDVQQIANGMAGAELILKLYHFRCFLARLREGCCAAEVVGSRQKKGPKVQKDSLLRHSKMAMKKRYVRKNKKRTYVHTFKNVVRIFIQFILRFCNEYV